MKTNRKRLKIEGDTRPALKPRTYLRFDDNRQAWAVLAPEHVYWPDETSVAILKKVDGLRRVSEIVTELAQEYDAPEEAVGSDVVEFLQNWADERLIGANGDG